MKSSGVSVICLIGLVIVATACDDLNSFSYENYFCQPRQTAIYEISVGKLRQGASANIQFASKLVQAEITLLTQDEIIMESGGLRLITNRQTGSTKIFIGNTYEKVTCVVDKFKM